MSTAVPPQQNPASVPVAAMPQGSPIPTESPSSTDGRRGPRRELSQSKRAAQNRAAQRAFRQRKEGYIKKLEHQVSDLATLEAQLKQVQTENYSLREYIIHLQSKLLDAKAELPSPPPNLNLSSPAAGANSSVSAAASALASAAAAAIAPAQPEHKAPAGLSSTNPLARVAQAVAQLGGGSATSNPGVSGSNGVKADKDDKDVKTGDEMDTAEEIDRQLQGPQDSYAPAMASV